MCAIFIIETVYQVSDLFQDNIHIFLIDFQMSPINPQIVLKAPKYLHKLPNFQRSRINCVAAAIEKVWIQRYNVIHQLGKILQMQSRRGKKNIF